MQAESEEYRKKWIESEGQGDTLRRTSRVRIEELEKQLHLLQQRLDENGRELDAALKNKDRFGRKRLQGLLYPILRALFVLCN